MKMSANNKSESSSNAKSAQNPPSKAATVVVPKSEAVSNFKPTVIGIYGIQGSGKSYLLNELKRELGEEKFAYHDGAAMITELVEGGFDAFKAMNAEGKERERKHAIETIGKRAAKDGKVAIVAGHLMLWSEGKDAGNVVWTEEDSKTYSHVLFLDVPAELIHRRREKDMEVRHTGARPVESVEHLRKWQDAEKEQLRELCPKNDILFTAVSDNASSPRLLGSVSPLFRDFQLHNEKLNLSRAESRLDEAFLAGQGKLETMLVLDADKTLSAADTGSMFWKRTSSSFQSEGNEYPLKTLFSGPLGYSYNAFRQATLLYEEAANDQEFEALCQEVASAVVMYPEFVSLLRQTAKQDHIGAVIVTCGLRQVWEIVLERNGLSQAVKVIGGGRVTDGFVVTDVVKAALVTRLKDVHQVYVWAFGDGPLDLKMLGKANEAIVVVGDEGTRSVSTEKKLQDAIDNEGLHARQAVLPSTASPRLDVGKLRLVNLTEQSFLDTVLRRHTPRATIRTFAATNKGAEKVLTAQSRDATFAGPALRGVHQRIGQYLAAEFLTDVIGVDIVVVTNVAQVKSIGIMARQLPCENFDLVALRLFGNKFTGTKGVDTGNRLFNTTNLA